MMMMMMMIIMMMIIIIIIIIHVPKSVEKVMNVRLPDYGTN